MRTEQEKQARTMRARRDRKLLHDLILLSETALSSETIEARNERLARMMFIINELRRDERMNTQKRAKLASIIMNASDCTREDFDLDYNKLVIDISGTALDLDEIARYIQF